MTIDMFRLSFVFTETILPHARREDIPLGAYVTENGYIRIVNALRRGSTAPLQLAMPWPYSPGQHFWDRYLSDRTARDADGRLCFQKLVPLRLPKLAERIEVLSDIAPAKTVRVGLEGFYYPHGLAVLVTMTVAGEFDTAAAGNMALRLRYDPAFLVTCQPDQPQPPCTLGQLATAALDRLRELGFGPSIAGRRSDLFSVTTILRGRDVDPNQPIAVDGPVHRLLNGLTGWVRDWQTRPAPPLVPRKTQLETLSTTACQGNVLFAAPQGRAVWFSNQFLPAAPGTHRLGCYHRNLTIGSMQIESLLMLAAADDAFRQMPMLPNSLRKLAELAADLLEAIHQGDKGRIYRSDSFRAHIEQSPQFGRLNALRVHLGRPAIP